MNSVVVLEPWGGGSHLAWAEGWRAVSRHRIDLRTLEPVGWRWRMHGAAVTLADDLRAAVADGLAPDLLVVSDMIDLSALLARLRRLLPAVPVALYLHENQLTYPRRPGEPLDRGLAWLTWKNLLAADAVWCNSAFHRDDLLAALPALLADVPADDHRHLLPGVAERMEVLPIPIPGLLDLHASSPARSAAVAPGPPLVVSNQRWHHDKDVGAVLRALTRLVDEGVEVRCAVLGDHTGGEAEALAPLLDRLGDRVVARGLQDRASYRRWLQAGDIVVSAARNEFFGIAVVEAVAAGCLPVVPRALAYPETIPARWHDVALYGPGELTGALRRAVVELPARRAAAAGLADAMTRFDATVVGARYDDAVDRLVGGRTGPGR